MLTFCLVFASGVAASALGFWLALRSAADAHLAPGTRNSRYD